MFDCKKCLTFESDLFNILSPVVLICTENIYLLCNRGKYNRSHNVKSWICCYKCLKSKVLQIFFKQSSHKMCARLLDFDLHPPRANSWAQKLFCHATLATVTDDIIYQVLSNGKLLKNHEHTTWLNRQNETSDVLLSLKTNWFQHIDVRQTHFAMKNL